MRAHATPSVDPSERAAARKIIGTEDETPDQEASRSVFDEPAFRAFDASDPPPGALTYRAWLEDMRSRVTPGEQGLFVTAAIIAAGPLAVLGAFAASMLGYGATFFSFLAFAVFGPTIEELMKVSVSSYIVEKRPYLVPSGGSLIAIGVLSGVVFASIENVLYLSIYISDPEPWLIAWRWTACLGLHAACSGVASIGLTNVWSRAVTAGVPPSLELGVRWLIAAIVIHGVYNALAILLGMIHVV
ncbi:MAG: PrsW family glutamic-type intramembrane protease [Planctomycetota bacterium]